MTADRTGAWTLERRGINLLKSKHKNPGNANQAPHKLV